MIRGRLFGGLGMDGADASHRSASLLGQVQQSASGHPIGLRTSPASSGLFHLVGSHSIGDLLDGHSPQSLSDWAARLAQAGAPADGLPRPGQAHAPFGPLGQGATTPTGGTGAPDAAPSSGGDAGPRAEMVIRSFDQPADIATFTLILSGTDANGPVTLREDGTVMFPHNWDVSSPSYSLAVSYHYTLHEGAGDPGPGDPAGDLGWSGAAGPTGLLAGFDIDQDNLTRFGLDRSAAAYYLLDYSGIDSFTARGTSTPTEPDGGGGTLAHHFNNSDGDTDQFHFHAESSANGLAVTWDNTTVDNFHDHDDGTDIDPATPENPDWLDESYTEDDQGTDTKTEHIEGNLSADGSFQLAFFRFERTADYDYQDSDNGTQGEPEPGPGPQQLGVKCH
jgi:hypothetical protein